MKNTEINEQAALEYEQMLLTLYGGYMRLPNDVKFKEFREVLPHICTICGNTTLVQPITMVGLHRTSKETFNAEPVKYNIEKARGCAKCRTTAKHIASLAEYQKKLFETHRGRYVFAYIPPRFNSQSSTYVLAFKCNRCANQLLRTADEMLDPKFKCPMCAQKKTTAASLYYQRRLDVLYSDTIKLDGVFKMTGMIRHRCTAGHKTLGSMVEMLNGKGCTHCGDKIDVPTVEYTYRNKKFYLRNQLEVIAFKYIAEKNKNHASLRTCLNYPVPILRKYRVPAFYNIETKMVIDVVAQDKLRAAVDRINRSFKRAPKMDVSYSLATVGNEGDVVLINSEEEWKALKKRRKWK